jgi:hypothetical protein
MEPEEPALPTSQRSVRGPYTEPDESSRQLHTLKVFRFKIHCSIIIWYTPVPLCSQTEMYALLI